ncbi:MAG: D-alanine--D-alanine ligase [Elusimicrobia bacterium]|nr:D-alanine--D-alanine ligase [Elusimicrobiota bacterium]
MDSTVLWLQKKRIAVLYGGWSEEAEISRRTGLSVLKAFKDLSLNAVGIELSHDLPEKLKKEKIGFCFIALHGKFGEDGTVQGLCEIMGIPYSGSGVLASALSMDKAQSKIIFKESGLPTPRFELVSSSRSCLRFPVVVKPNDGGSAIGIAIVKKEPDLKKAVAQALKYSKQVLIEEFIEGKEITAPILGKKVLPLIEIIPKHDFYDYASKYEIGMSQHLIPARLSYRCARAVSELAYEAHCILGCRAFSRVDFIIDKKNKPWILELNSIPGMTETSLYPEAAKAAGLDFSGMILEMVKYSIADGKTS